MNGGLYLADHSPYFGGYRPQRDSTLLSLVGVPFDSTSSFRPGQRFAPREIRRASMYIEFNSLRTGIDFESVGVYDEGDVAVVHGDAGETIARVADVVSGIVEEGRVPILLGGEHTITLGALRALRKRRPCVLWVDAHMDLREEYLGLRLGHASVLRRALEEGSAKSAFILGARGFSRDEEEWARVSGVNVVTSREVENSSIARLSLMIKKWLVGAGCGGLYVSIDMDVFDPCYAPGVGNPEPEGLVPGVVFDVLAEVVSDDLLGFDVVEVSPPFDPSGITSVLAAKTVVEIGGMWWRARWRGRPSYRVS
ncbi:MAG: agmatinase [Desulfurococcales archaeon]|nr:agmatinase [Desulfurococcales archaeon]